MEEVNTENTSEYFCNVHLGQDCIHITVLKKSGKDLYDPGGQVSKK